MKWRIRHINCCYSDIVIEAEFCDTKDTEGTIILGDKNNFYKAIFNIKEVLSCLQEKED